MNDVPKADAQAPPAYAPPLTPEARTPAMPPRRPRLRTFDALGERNFRWFYASLLGNFTSLNMQMFIRGWLVYEITGSYEALGLMAGANGITGLVLAPLGGVVADRVRQKKHVVQLGQAINALAALTIGLLIAMGWLQFWHLLVVAVVQGSVMNVMMPARQAMTPEVIGMGRLTNAIALNATGMNAARLLMPGLAGWMVGALGGGGGDIGPAQYVYFLMAVLYAWSSATLMTVRVGDRAPSDQTPAVLRELKLGFRYMWRTPSIRLLLFANFFMVFFGMTYFMLLPGFAKDVLDAGPGKLGLLQSTQGVGALVGSLIIASLPDRGRGVVLLVGTAISAVGLIGFALSTHYWLSIGLLAVVGFGQAARMSLTNVLIQTYVDDEYRGRVMSIYMLEFSLMAISVYPVGLLANLFGPQFAVGASGIGLLALVLGLLVLAPTYRRME